MRRWQREMDREDHRDPPHHDTVVPWSSVPCLCGSRIRVDQSQCVKCDAVDAAAEVEP